MSRAVGAGTCERGARKVWAARPGTVAWTLAALALALGAPHAVRAQAVSPEAPEAATARELSSTAAALERALDSLVPRLRRAQAEADSVRARRRAERLATRAPMDTVEVGAAVVVTPRGEGEGARAFLEVVWEDEYGDWAPAEARPGGPWIAFQWSADRMDFHLPDRTLIRVQGAPWRTREYMEEGARDAFGAVLTRTLQETGVGHWLDGMMVRSPERPRWIWRGMATTASAPVRACLHGELSACATALSLETDATPFDEWYTLEQRRLLVRRNARLWTRYAEGREVMRACLDGDDASCDEALALYRERQLGGPGVAGTHPYWGAPLPNWVRATFLWHAVRQGGPGTWERLVHAADAGMEPGPALERATGRSTEELLAGWRGWLGEQRPRRENRAGAGTLATLLWAVLFLTLATRSTRWRLG